jgi:hypothetical protein
MKETVLFTMPLFLVFAPIYALVVSLCLVGTLGYVLCSCLRRCLPLLAIARLLNVENLLALALLALACVVSLSIPVVSLLVVLILLFQSLAEVIV